MTTEVHELPEVGEIVVATISKITAHGAYATLDEYNDIQGFLHASEIAHGWVRNINKFVKSGEKKVLLVKRIKEGREEIDLSLKQVSRDQQKKKLLDVKRFEKGKGILKNIQEKAKLSDNDVEKLEDKILSRYDSVYDGAVDILTNGIKVFTDLKLPKKTLDIIVEVSTKIKLPSVEIRGILELTDNSSNGIENIRNSLQSFEKVDQNDIKILYIGAPKYRISVTASDFKSAEKTLKPILEDIQKNIEKNKGSFKFTREESRKTGGE
ncbi:MAG: S1 RNA-binding domain-containing protein [Candidatus Nitrosopelagicus sp.]|nr:S1 RNA-binding domain-containing protein [Candidatus Nitrosopelagicus sp.]